MGSLVRTFLHNRIILMQLYLFLILVHKLKLNMAKIYLPEENFSTEEKIGSDIFVVKLAETQKIRNDITHLMSNSEEYGAPFRSIDVITLKTFAEALNTQKCRRLR